MWTIPKLPTTQPGYRLAFFGPMCSGKTYCADYLVENYGYYKTSFASKLKAIAYELYGVEGKNGDNRRIIQELGDALRQFDDDVFSKYTLTMIKESKGKVVIDDLRLPREAQLLKESGFDLVLVNCPDAVRSERINRLYPDVPSARQSHATEQSWAKIVPDRIVQSVGLADLTDLDRLVESYEPY